MSPFLQALLGQQAAPEVAPIDNEIVVESPRNTSERGGPVDGLSAPNDRAIEAVQADVKRGEEASQRRGLFGVKGTLRDVLGLVGDAFLVQGGRDPYYAPRRRQEQISDAVAGFTEDPVSAAERTAYYDPKIGRELYGEHEDNLTRQAQAASLKASREATEEDKEFARYRRAREMLGGLFNTPGAVQNGTVSPAALQQAQRIAASAGMSLEEFMINEGMSEEDVRNFAASTARFVDQERLEDSDQNIGIAGRNADSRAISARASAQRAARPPAGRSPPNPTEASEFARIRAAVNRGERLSPGDAATWKKYTAPPSTRGRGRGGSTSRFRPTTN